VERDFNFLNRSQTRFQVYGCAAEENPNDLDRARRLSDAAFRATSGRVLDAGPEEGWNRIGFEGKPEFRNRSRAAGLIQGGILPAMLDDTMGPAVFLKTNGRLTQRRST